MREVRTQELFDVLATSRLLLPSTDMWMLAVPEAMLPRVEDDLGMGGLPLLRVASGALPRARE